MNKSKNEGKIRPVQIRVSESEYKQMEEKACKLGLTVSAYLRLVALYAEIGVVLNIEK